MPTKSPLMHGMTQLLLTYGVAAGAGLIAFGLDVPLPWLLGPVAGTALVSLWGASLRVPGFTRWSSQVVIGATVGLAFTTQATNLLAEQLPMILLLTVFTLVSSLTLACIVARLTKSSAAMSCIACLPVGPAEATSLAQRYGLEPTPVVFSQSLRSVILILFVVPLVVGSSDATDFSALHEDGSPTLGGTSLLTIGALLIAFLFRFARIPNWSFLGAMSFAAVAANTGLPVDRFPAFILGTAQVLLGVSLGALFKAKIFFNMRHFIAATSAATCMLITLCIVLGLSLAEAMSISLQTAALSFAPGSLAEMALTAKLVASDPAYVTAFHAVRIYVVLLMAPLVLTVVTRDRKPGA